jgi:hypothetical protein
VHRVESLQRVLGGDLGMVGEERRVVDGRDDEPVAEPFRVLERHAVVVARRRIRESCGPEVERLVRSDAPLNGMHHPRSGTTAADAGVLEESDVAAGCSILVGVEQVVDGGVVLVDRLLHEPQAENLGVVGDVLRRIAGDTRDVVDPVQPHPSSVTVDR